MVHGGRPERPEHYVLADVFEIAGGQGAAGLGAGVQLPDQVLPLGLFAAQGRAGDGRDQEDQSDREEREAEARASDFRSRRAASRLVCPVGLVWATTYASRPCVVLRRERP